ncbi:unnamed protein product [Rhizophagus irregularis]|nr:unnamed protein product [Rhizophagus irregularis]
MEQVGNAYLEILILDKQRSGIGFRKRDPSRNWEEHLTYIFKSCFVHFNRNLIAKKFDNEVHLLAKSIPTRSSVEEVHECFKKLELYDNKRIIDWVQYYRQPYVLASLNKYISNMENEIWDRHGNNTNIAEAAHAQANREGKQLKLLTAIMRGRRLDERLFKIAEINDKFGDTSEESKIPMQDITNREQPKRGKRKNTTSENNLKSKKIKIDIDDSNDEQETTSENNSKTKQTNKTKIDIDSSNEEQEIIKLEIEERKMKLAERRTADRKAQAEIEKLELENLKLRKRT